MSAIDVLLSRLEKLHPTSAEREWTARCPAHTDRSPSLSLRELPDGRVLLHCHAGCSVEQVCAALGLELSDLFPPNPITKTAIGKTALPFSPQAVLRCLGQEALIVYIVACDIAQGKTISPEDRARLALAQQRLADASAYV